MLSTLVMGVQLRNKKSFYNLCNHYDDFVVEDLGHFLPPAMENLHVMALVVQ